MSLSVENLDREGLLVHIQQLTQQVEALTAQNTDLEIILDTIVEHSTTLEQQVYQQQEELRTAERHVRQLNTALEERVRLRTAELEAANLNLAKESAERKQAQEESLALAQQLLEQRLQTIERTYEAVHNGPLQELAVLLRTDSGSFTEQQLRDRLHKLNQDLRGIYQSMRHAVSNTHDSLYLEGGLILDLATPIPALLQQTFDHTLERDFPGFRTILFQITPNFSALEATTLSTEQKRGLCLFLEEALCNVGKHALGTTRLEVTCDQKDDRYRISIIDNGSGLTLNALPSTDQQGTRQAQSLAQKLSGSFQRCPHSPQGTRCELDWPIIDSL